jgi:IPT/TIG domain
MLRMRRLPRGVMAIWGAFGAFTLATGAAFAAIGVLSPATAGAAANEAARAITPSGTIGGEQVRSGEGTPGLAPLVVPLRVADQEAYAREKQRAAKLAAQRTTTPEAGVSEPGATTETTEAASAVFGSLNATGLSAAQAIAAFGEEVDVTPPDTTGAIGPEYYVEVVNEEIVAYSRASLAMVGSPVELSTFTGGVAPCDPQIKYDPQSSRWFYAAIRCDKTSADKLYVGWSKTGDPADLSTATGHGWCGYAYETGKTLEDYPKLGLDASHIIVGANAFSMPAGSFLTAHILSLPKPPAGAIETCPPAPTLTTFGSKAEPLRTSVSSHVATSPEPATVADESPSGYVVSADMATPFSGNGSHVMIWQVAGTGASPELLALGAPSVSAFKLPPNVPQPGSSDELDTLDSRLTQAVAAADPNAGGAEAVWTQQTIGGGAGTVVRWYELLPGKLEVRQSGAISSASLYAFNGAIAPTLAGGAAIDYDTGSSSAKVQIAAQTRAASDPLGTMSNPVVLQSSAAIDSDFSCPTVEPTSISCRWGDYAGASTDPSNTEVVWGSNQFNGPTASHRAQWATQNFALIPGTAAIPPTVVTESASKVTSSSAKLHASVNPNGEEVTECEFEYGTSSSYGSSVPCSALPGSGTSPVAVSASLTGLAANTAYHFRISATNAGGTSEGSDEAFTTLASPPAVTAVEPAEGPQTGGATVTITGTGFTGATAVDFGANAAKSFEVESDTSITAESPAGTGTVDVTVTTAEGTSATGAADRFTYVPSEGCDYWTNTAGGSWFTASSWSKGAPPGAGEEACITASGTYTVTMSEAGSNVSLKSLTVGGESGTQTLLVGGSCLTSTALSATEGVTVNARGAITLTDTELCAAAVTLGGAVVNAGTITAERGLGGARTLQGDLTNTATVAIDTSATVEGNLTNEKLLSLAAGATLQVGGGYAQSKRGKLETAIESASSFGALSVGGAAALAGKLALLPAKGFTPPLGQTFPIVAASSRTGTFAKETKAVIKKSLPGLYYDPVYSATGVTLVVTQAILADAPGEGAPGSAVTLSGSGFPAGDKIKLWFKDHAGAKTTYANVFTGAGGEFSAEVALPANAAPGSGTFFAKSVSTGVKAIAAFTVN